MIRKKDIRLRILEHFSDLNQSTSETIANPWLSKQHEDLGIIRRAVSELIQFEHLCISGKGKEEAVAWLEKEWNTTTHNSPQTQDDRDKKSSLRLIEDVGRFNKVSDVRMYATFNGIKFLQEYKRFDREHYFKISYILLVAILSFILSVLLYRLGFA